jgi:hypothetical protein
VAIVLSKPVATAGKLHFLINQAGRSRLFFSIRVPPSLQLAKRRLATIDTRNLGGFSQQVILYSEQVRIEIDVGVVVR